ncbi:MAG: PhnD/SsuA/transferrin family substrate-binding protein [Candidatus Eremiobacterota bacterium]
MLTAVSILSDNHSDAYRAVSQYVGRRLGIPVDFCQRVPWQEREAMLYRGQAHFGFLCGLPYVRQARRQDPPLELLAAPVMRGERYQGEPIYFSDVIVHRQSGYGSFQELRGSVWAYNGADSHSGYNLVASHLARNGLDGRFFARVRESGAHLQSLSWVLQGTVDASAIDATVLESELSRRPSLAEEVRILEVLGPSPMCPAVASTRLPEELKRGLREALLGMHADPEGAEVLAGLPLLRFSPVSDPDYDPIRRMEAEAATISL